MTSHSDLRKAAEMALEVFEHLSKGESPAITKGELVYEIAALRQALSQSDNEAPLKQGWRQCAVGQRTTQYCGIAQQAYLDGVNSGIEAEREACAKVCETNGIVHPVAAAAIRARGEK